MVEQRLDLDVVIKLEESERALDELEDEVDRIRNERDKLKREGTESERQEKAAAQKNQEKRGGRFGGFVRGLGTVGGLLELGSRVQSALESSEFLTGFIRRSFLKIAEDVGLSDFVKDTVDVLLGEFEEKLRDASTRLPAAFQAASQTKQVALTQALLGISPSSVDFATIFRAFNEINKAKLNFDKSLRADLLGNTAGLILEAGLKAVIR